MHEGTYGMTHRVNLTTFTYLTDHEPLLLAVKPLYDMT